LFEKQENIIDFVVKNCYNEKQSLYNTPGKPALLPFPKKNTKQETLIHCIIHDQGQITELITVLSSFLSKYDTQRKNTWKTVRNNLKGDANSDILNAFAAEVESHETFILDSAQAPDVPLAKEVVDALLTFSLNNINLQIKPNIDISRDWKVVGENCAWRVLT